METWHVGDRVFAFWEEDGYWYPATILQIDGEVIKVRYGDDDVAELDEVDVDELVVSVGDFVENQAADDGLYYEAEISEVQGDRIQVTYEDGSTEWTMVSTLRLIDWQEWAEGDRVFAYWEGDGYWYPAVITQIDDDGLHICYDDGDEEVTDIEYLAEISVSVGDMLENKSADDGLYYAAEIVDIQDDQFQVQYEDGSTAWTDISTLRVEGEEEE